MNLKIFLATSVDLADDDLETRCTASQMAHDTLSKHEISGTQRSKIPSGLIVQGTVPMHITYFRMLHPVTSQIRPARRRLLLKIEQPANWQTSSCLHLPHSVLQ
jgi:hypothetical protein